MITALIIYVLGVIVCWLYGRHEGFSSTGFALGFFWPLVLIVGACLWLHDKYEDWRNGALW